MTGITSGKVGGVMGFRDQVLKPAPNALDGLSKTMVDSVNSVHRDGVDAEGQLGGDLYGFEQGHADKATSMIMLTTSELPAWRRDKRV